MNKSAVHRILQIGVFVFLVAITGCTTSNSGDLKYENILMPQPMPSTGWKTSQSKRTHSTWLVWNKENEKLLLDIFHGKNRFTPEKYRTVVDYNAQQRLTTSFESKTLKEGSVNNYPMLLWETSAMLKNGSKVTTLCLYIQGNDAGYGLIRSWFKAEVPADERQTWIDYLLSVKVVDNRYPEHVGPKLKKSSGTAAPPL